MFSGADGWNFLKYQTFVRIPWAGLKLHLKSDDCRLNISRDLVLNPIVEKRETRLTLKTKKNVLVN